MKAYAKNFLAVLIVTSASYALQLVWILIAEPIMEACGVMFVGIFPSGDIIGAAAVFLCS